MQIENSNTINVLFSSIALGIVITHANIPVFKVTGILYAIVLHPL